MIHIEYNGYLVGLSILIASLAGYVALDLAGRVTVSRGRSRAAWIAGSATAMGIGIWSMHFVAMLALRTPMRIAYDVPLVLLSVVIAIGGSAVTFVMSARRRVGLAALAIASLFMGPAIAGMHYTGMTAMRMPARTSYDPFLFWLSIAIAIGVSFVALQLAVRLRHRDTPRGRHLKIASGLLMGAAVYGMHYTGMLAARFIPDPNALPSGGFSILGTHSLAAAVAATTMIILALAVVGATADKRIRARAEEAVALRESEARYRLLFESNPLPMWVFDAETLRVLAVNDAAIAHYGYSREEFHSLTLAELRSPDEMKQLDDAIRQSAHALTFIPGLRHRTKDGRVIDVEKTLHPIQFQGRAARLALVNDITRRLEAETALRRTMDLLRAVIDDSPIPIIATDLELRVTRSNHAAQALFGWTPAELVGRPYDEIVPAERADQLRALQEAALRGQATTHVQTVHRRKDGSPLDVSVSLAVLRDAESVATGYVFLVADETARKELEAQVRQSQRMEAVGQLAGGVAHDFNNIITAIMSYGQFLLQDLDSDDRRRDDVVAILEAASRAAGLTRQLLAFSRQQVRKPEILSLNATISELGEMVRRLIPSNITLRPDLDESLGLINADAGQIEQVIVNLVVNARDALPNGGEIVLQTRNVSVGSDDGNGPGGVPPGEYVALSVSDNGVGILPEIQGRIFEPFFTTKEAGKGTGLGLATVYGVVKQNEGHVSVDSMPGIGSTFAVHFPRVAGAPLPKREAPRPAAIARGSETILLVEDNEMVLAATKRTLTRAGYRVLEVRSGREALRIYEAEQDSIDLVITDLVMAEIGGYELEQTLRRKNPELRLLFISGYSKDALAGPVTVPAGNRYLAKPFTAEELTKRVREVLRDGVVDQATRARSG